MITIIIVEAKIIAIPIKVVAMNNSGSRDSSKIIENVKTVVIRAVKRIAI